MKLMNKNTKAGFTLVELIVVIAILGILAGIAVPTYSGYIKKANEAADNMLLSAVNTAFGAACIENGKANIDFADDSVTLSINNKKIVGVSGAADDINTSFARYFGDNKTTELKYYESAADFEFKDGMFRGKRTSSGGSASPYSITIGGRTFTVSFNDDDIKNVNDSSFVDEGLGVDTLLNQVDAVTTLASDYLNRDSGKGNELINAVLHRSDFLAFAAEKMGGTLTGDELATALAWVDAYKAYQSDNSSENAAALEALESQIGSWDQDKQTYLSTMRSSLDSTLTNAMVFYAAAQSSALNNDTFRSELAAMNLKGTSVGQTVSVEGDMFSLGMKAYESIVRGQGTDSDSTAMAKAAYGYAMSIAYNNYKSKDGNSSVTWAQYLDSAQGKADFDAYASCMNMINSNATTADFTTALVEGGFNDIGLINSIISALSGNN